MISSTPYLASLIKNPNLNCRTDTECRNMIRHCTKSYDLCVSDKPKNMRNEPGLMKKRNYWFYTSVSIIDQKPELELWNKYWTQKHDQTWSWKLWFVAFIWGQAHVKWARIDEETKLLAITWSSTPPASFIKNLKLNFKTSTKCIDKIKAGNRS